jgi:hypothetical protein
MRKPDPRLCNKCFVFPCICGSQYTNLSKQQLTMLMGNLANIMESGGTSRTLRGCLSDTDMEQLPKRFVNHLFNSPKHKQVKDVWDNLESSNLLWRSCLTMFLSKFSYMNNTHKYFTLMREVLVEFDMPHNNIMLQVLLAGDATGSVNKPLIYSAMGNFIETLEDEDYYVKSYIIPCVKIATFDIKDPGMDLLRNMGLIIAAISGLETDNILKTMDVDSIDIEDQMIFVDERMCQIIQRCLHGEFDGLLLL